MRIRALFGDKRARVVVLFACVLALESADLATVGAAAPELEGAFHISNTQLGLLAAISTMVGAIVTVPIGALTDRGGQSKGEAEEGAAGSAPEAEGSAARRAVDRRQVPPVREHILRQDPASMSLWRAIVYVLKIPANRWLIAASAVGYFFFAGL